MPAASLVSMTQRACIRNLPGITDVADAPYEVIRPVLRKITNPQQLRDIEERSPHIADADAELWRAFIARDIPGWETKILTPKNPRSWWKVYKKLIREEGRAKEEQEEQLRLAMGGLEKKREVNQAKFVGKVIQEPHSRGKAFVDGVPNPKANSWGIVREPALRNAKRGRDVLNAIRKQSSNAARDNKFGLGGPARFAVPSAKTQIQKAPEWMVRDQKKPAPIVLTKPAGTGAPGKTSVAQVFAPKRGRTATDKAIDDAVRHQNAVREARLRALTDPKKNSVEAQHAVRAQTHIASAPSTAQASRLGVAATQEVKLSPSPAPQVLKKRAAPTASPFMPAKKRKT